MGILMYILEVWVVVLESITNIFYDLTSNSLVFLGYFDLILSNIFTVLVAEVFKFSLIVIVLYYIWSRRESKNVFAPIYPTHSMHNKTGKVIKSGAGTVTINSNKNANANARNGGIGTGTGTIYNPRGPGGVGSTAVVMRPTRMNKNDAGKTTTTTTTTGMSLAEMMKRSAGIWNAGRYNMTNPRKVISAEEMERIRNPGGPPKTRPRSRSNSLLGASSIIKTNSNNSKVDNGNDNGDGKCRAKAVRFTYPLPTPSPWDANAGSAAETRTDTKTESSPLNSDAWSLGTGAGSTSAAEKNSSSPFGSGSSSVSNKGSVFGKAASAFGGIKKGGRNPTALGPFH